MSTQELFAGRVVALLTFRYPSGATTLAIFCSVVIPVPSILNMKARFQYNSDNNFYNYKKNLEPSVC